VDIVHDSTHTPTKVLGPVLACEQRSQNMEEISSLGLREITMSRGPVSK
jgi:hypothetical protein